MIIVMIIIIIIIITIITHQLIPAEAPNVWEDLIKCLDAHGGGGEVRSGRVFVGQGQASETTHFLLKKQITYVVFFFFVHNIGIGVL